MSKNGVSQETPPIQSLDRGLIILEAIANSTSPVSLSELTGVLGIVRTYTTRVGEGPFPTEMLDGEAEMGQLIRERGREYGASTGRPRRCGWFDAFATRYAAEINGFTSIALTKLDVLDALDEIKVCVGYELNGRRCDSLPSVSQDLRRVVRDQVRARYPAATRLAFILDNFSVHKGDEVREWAASNDVELAYTPHYASWLNRIEPQFKGVRYFCLDGTDHPDHETQTRLIHGYLDWRNAHRDNPKLRHLTRRQLTHKAA